MILYSIGILLLLIILRYYLRGPRNRLNRSLKESYIVITGASKGIGRETALQLCAFRPKCLILLSRTEPKDLIREL